MKSFLSWTTLSQTRFHFLVTSIFLISLIIIVILFLRMNHLFSETIFQRQRPCHSILRCKTALEIRYFLSWPHSASWAWAWVDIFFITSGV